jgi:dynein light chain Tctex-type 1
LVQQHNIGSTQGLQSLNRPYKYAITVIVMQKNGAGLVSAASTYWDTRKDGLCKVVWENGTMHCVVTVYGTCVNINPEDAERHDAAV